jgi:NAD(P)-dependent dehydrogenase (short-subunit alcohol dehydrogenase family)
LGDRSLLTSHQAASRELDDKVALVTCAGSGIGYAIAERFAHEGAAVAIDYLGQGGIKCTAHSA